MRCPKCATSFVVEKPSTSPEVSQGLKQAPTFRELASPAKPVNPLKATMIGVAGPAMAPPVRAAAPVAVASGKAAKVEGPVVEPTGVPPRKPPPPPNREAAAVRPQPTSNSEDLPSVPRPKPAQVARNVPVADSDLPAALMARPKSPQTTASPTTDSLPALSDKSASSLKPKSVEIRSDEEWSLPELAKEPPLVTPANSAGADGALDFSLPGSASAARPATQSRTIDVDLPSPLEAKSKRVKPTHDDLEIDLPSPFEGIGETNGGRTRGGNEWELDLPSPTDGIGLPKVGGRDLPSVVDERLPVVHGGHSGLPAARGFGEVDLLPNLAQGPDLEVKTHSSRSESIPDLEAPLGSEVRRAGSKGSTPSQGSAAKFELPDLTDALPIESIPPRAASDSAATQRRVSAPPAPQSGLEFGELNMESLGGATELSPAKPSEDASAIVRQSGGGTQFGEVSLDVGGVGEASIGTIDDGPVRAQASTVGLEFGALPQEVASKEPTVERGLGREVASPPVAKSLRSSGARDDSRPRRRSVSYAIAGVLALAVMGGASLVLLPDVGFFGYFVISDQVRKPEYERVLAQQVTAAQSALSSDIYTQAVRALNELERVQHAHPRAKGVRAYLGFLGYAVDLRFGQNAERSARSKMLLEQLAQKGFVPGLELAMTARAAGEGNLARAHKLIDEIRRSEPKRTETFVISAQIEMLDRRPGQSLVYWREVESSEHSARSAYGCSTAELALGQVEAAEKSANNAISRQPKHISARLMLARIALDRRGDVGAAEKLLEEALQYQSESSPSEQVATQALLGDLNLSRSRISAAEAAYTRALALDPRSSAALRGLGEALYRSGRYAEALARFEAAVQADPDDTAAAVGVAKAQLSLERVRDAAALLTKLRTSHSQSYSVNYWYGASQEAMGNREEAEKAFTNAIELGGSEPAIIDAYIALALLKSQQGRREEAQKLLDTAREKLPKSPRILNAIGQVALSEGRYEAAIADFRQALNIDSTDISAKFRLGVALRKSRVFDEALKCFVEVAAVDHEYPGLALERGLLYENSGRTEEALKAFEDALAKAPNDVDLLLRVGCGKVSAGRPKEAEDLLRKVLAQRPNSAETHHCLGRAQLLEGTNLVEALRTLERAVELDPYRPEYHLYVGWAANEAGRISVAEQALKKALSLDQGLGDAYWQRGVLRFRQGAVKDAVLDLTKAIELRPSRTEAHAALAEAFYELGMEPKALEQWRIAVAAQPDNAGWHFSLGKLLQAASRDAEAKSELEKSLELGQKLEPLPRWIWEAHRLLARSIGMQPAAIPHWQEYLKLSPLDNAYRDEAKQALAKLGQPYQGQ